MSINNHFLAMQNFIPGQRWVSATESELGLGLILECDYSRVTVLFLACGEKRIYARDNAPLIRVTFAPGDTIESVENKRLTVHRVDENNGLMVYVVVDEGGEERHLPEIDLNHHIQFNKPQERVFTGQVDPGEWFNLRFDTWRRIQCMRQSPVCGLIGGRTSLISHQLYIAHEAANRYAPRIMLADEVGLGKTIEAGLILHHRLFNGLSKRVLVLVPETLLHQWLVEMLRRFNLRFSVFDEERCVETHSDNPFLSEQLVICSQGFFTRQAHRRQQVLAAGWDMVVVDEAHHLEWDETAPSVDYQLVEKLGQASPGLLLLTATPEQLGKKSHFARLRLLDSDRFYSFDQFIEEERNFEPVATAARLLLEKKPLDNALLEKLKQLLKQNNVKYLLQRIKENNASEKAREELINILLDHHGTGRVLFRNSRQTVQGFPQRQRHGYVLQANPDGRAATLKNDPRFSWLVNKMRELAGQKALLICRQARTASDLERNLKIHGAIRVAVFHEGMTIIERDRAAAYFADPETGAQLLVCSEIGSEGRNFQFAHHLVLFDLPENPDLLQQRIGRLDRIGQQHTIQIHIPYLQNSAQHILYRWYDEGLNAFLVNNTAAQHVYRLLRKELSVLLQNYDQQKIDLMIEKTQQLAQDMETELHNGRDLLLELSSCRKQQAEKLIAQVDSIDREQAVWPYMDKLLDCYGVEVEYHSPDCYIITPGNHMRIAHFPQLPEDGFTVTVNRNIALSREELQFLTWEHPMVTGAMDLVLSSDTGNAAISIVKHQHLNAGQFLLEALFVVECSAPADLQIGRFLPPTPVRVLLDQQYNDLTEKIAHSSLKETEHHLEISQLLGFLADQRQHINKMIDLAKSKAEQTMHRLINESGALMLETQGNELKRLVSLKKLNPGIRQEEIERQKNMLEAAFGQINEARLKLDAVRLIITA